MSLNDQKMLNQSAKGSNIYPSIANPTKSSGTTDPITSNFVHNPTTPSKGAGAGPNFHGHRNAKHAMKEHYGVIESHPGIIESTNIDPLMHETK
ncbi:hypothetical protein CPB84DRAFT_1776567 [Gymnopilus junonius]|uniref:Uncharacterized protein n=1 Tax=Gymnopilus junonius TaxID=109634 RepID=A0A9P5NQW6_GYMJU|nr:hypothetical protein CPB84DRAFT_1776567 [Gymnopilus junonius]